MLRIPQSREKPIRLKVFSGAYAIYSGKVFAFFTTQSMVVAIHVVEYNETHATLTIYSNMFGKETKNTTTIPLSNPWSKYFNTSYHHEETEYIAGLGVRDCYVYVNETGQSAMHIYIDKETLWPLKFEINLREIGYTIVLELKDSNIFQQKT